MTRNTMTNAETNDKAAAVAEQGAQVAPEKAPSKKGASKKDGAPKAKKAAKGGKAKAAAPKKEAKAGGKAAKPAKAAKTPKKASTPRAESKGAKILEMIGRAKGATLAEIQKATGWQPHSVRGFISTTGKKHGIKIESSKNEVDERVYRAAK